MASDNFTFRGKHSLEDMGIYTEITSLPLCAEPKTVYEDLPGTDGEMNFTHINPKGRMCYKPRIIEMQCHFADESESHTGYLRRISELASWLSDPNDWPLIFDDEPDIMYKAHVANLFHVEGVTDFSGTFPLIFKCDPFKYRTTEYVVDGRDNVNFYNNGYYAPAKIFIEGIFESGLELMHHSEGIRLHINTPITEGTVIVDTENMTVKHNGVSILHKCSGEFFEVTPGSNCIGVLNEFAEGLSITLRYTERFL